MGTLEESKKSYFVRRKFTIVEEPECKLMSWKVSGFVDRQFMRVRAAISPA